MPCQKRCPALPPANRSAHAPIRNRRKGTPAPPGLAAVLFVLAVGLSLARTPAVSAAEPAPRPAVLVVMSYEESYPWVKDIREGIEKKLDGAYRTVYAHMNTKTEPARGEERAREMWNLYESLRPTGVIVADDDAQRLFVVPYLKDKVDTPVIFCGVNATPETYGYPASNVTGVLEREAFREALSLLQMLVPSAATFGYISDGTPTAHAVLEQLDGEKDDYPLRFEGVAEGKDLDSVLAAVRELSPRCDAMIYITLEGLADSNGGVLTDADIIPRVAEAFPKPLLTNIRYRVECGALLAVAKSGQEQGFAAAELFLQAMGGVPVASIPIRQNQYGTLILNADRLRALAIAPSASTIRTATLVTTIPRTPNAAPAAPHALTAPAAR